MAKNKPKNSAKQDILSKSKTQKNPESYSQNSSCNASEKKKVLELLESLSGKTQILNDESFNAIKNSITERSYLYSKILSDYETFIKDSLHDKRQLKQIVCWVSIVIISLSVLGTISAFICYFVKPFELKNWISTIIPLIISFLTVFIVIPEIITKYLFNTDEEKYMYYIIRDLLKHDISMVEKNTSNNSTPYISSTDDFDEECIISEDEDN